MRLVKHLVLPQLLVAVIFAIALAFFVLAFAQIASLTDEIQRDYLVDLEDEERLHRAAWDVEVAIRHGQAACEESQAREVEVNRIIRTAGDALAATLRTYPKGALDHLRRAADGYGSLVEKLTSGDTCARIAKLRSSHEGLALDEELTDAWIARVSAIRVAFAQRERETERVGVRAAVIGVALALVSSMSAATIALRTARGMTASLAQLAAHARRVGEGDFAPLPLLKGADEIRGLALDLDRMRGRLAEVDQLKQAFVASVSHDLRTPLARLREALALLADGATGPLNERQQRVVVLARIACEKEIRIVTALLDLSRVRSGQPLMRDAGCSVDQILRTAVADVAELAQDAGVILEVEATGESPRGDFDAMLVERALVNVINNAVAVSKPGQRVRVARGILEPDGGARSVRWVEIQIRDEGPGIDPALRERLFEPYGTRAVEAQSGTRRGTGIGLSIAREMVRAHGGELVLLDDGSAGATFCLRLPLDPPVDAGVGAKRRIG